MEPISRAAALAIRMVWRTRGEPIINWVRPHELSALLAAAGWSVLEQVPAPELADRYLKGSSLPKDGLSPGAIVVSATKAQSACP